ncbi:hypothetical protein [Streptomyces sp. C10-9-1]|uniref:hypothetical protein n=1 Tax=Streptomyces sp. C10-9-1 TaxID=1859285 RepID=UPI003F49E518
MPRPKHREPTITPGEPAALYCRISQADDDDQTGVDRQERLLAAARAAARVSAAGQQVFASRRWPQVVRRSPHQVTLLARCLTEAA